MGPEVIYEVKLFQDPTESISILATTLGIFTSAQVPIVLRSKYTLGPNKFFVEKAHSEIPVGLIHLHRNLFSSRKKIPDFIKHVSGLLIADLHAKTK